MKKVTVFFLLLAVAAAILELSHAMTRNYGMTIFMFWLAFSCAITL